MRFVEGVCRGAIEQHLATAPVNSSHSGRSAGRALWTTWQHRAADDEQRNATERWARARRAIENRKLARHPDHLAALSEQQRSLIEPTMDLVYQETRMDPWVLVRPVGVRRHAMGVPVYVGERLCAVISPVASCITHGLARRFSSATVVVADEDERARIAAVTLPHQRFRIVTSSSPVDVCEADSPRPA